MATRSHVGWRDPNGTIRAVYTHYDGYPEGVLKHCLYIIETKGIAFLISEIERGIVENGIRSWFDTGAETFNDAGGSNDVISKRIQLNEEYAYIFDYKTGSLVEAYDDGEQVDPKDFIKQATN